MQINATVRIDAGTGIHKAMWHHERPGHLALGVWTDLKAGCGEDAEPLLVHNRAADRGVAAVFDGVGGAGATAAGRSGRGIDRSQAWVASRAVRGLMEEWFLTAGQGKSSDPADELRTHLERRLPELRTTIGRRVQGSMRRELPTTLAALTYRLHCNVVEWQALWAGDSRCYLLNSVRGLQQISRDDTESGDALDLLIQDPPMTNLVSVDRRFRINTHGGSADLPCVLICATDGFFGYVGTPADFEHLLLDTLATAGSVAHWSELIADRVCSYTGDDASLVLAGFGFADLRRLRDLFLDRLQWLHATQVMPVRRAGDRQAFVRARADAWETYRHTYESRMPQCRQEERL